VLGLVLDQTDGFHTETLGQILRQRGVDLLAGETEVGQPPSAQTPSQEQPLSGQPVDQRERNETLLGSTTPRSPSRSASSAVLNLTAAGGAGAVTWTVPLQLTISLGPLTPPARSAGVGATEGMFGRAQPLAAAPARFSLDSLTAPDFDWNTALSLALACKLAYSPPGVVQNTGLSSWRLTTCVFLEQSQTQCFVAATPAAVLVAFRGTESLGDWIADLNLASINRPYGTIHRGFHFAYQDIRPQVEQALATLGNRQLLLTGHSLGAALATIAAVELSDRFRIAGIYTYGQPRVGTSGFRSFFNQRFGNKLYRFVNDDDIVPRIPPGYLHVGKLFHFNPQGSLESTLESTAPATETTEPRPLTPAEFDQLRADLLATRASRQVGAAEALTPTPALEGFFPSISDHSMDEYIRKIALHAS